MLKVGTLAPDFSAQDQHGTPLSLRSLLERGTLVLYFYPKDFTPVCTAQVCTFRDAAHDLAALGANVVGVSGDKPDCHERFSAEHRVPFALISDPNRTIIKQYRASFPLIPHTLRITYLIAPTRLILGAFHHELSATRHLADVKRLLNVK